jgi:hypothetical protein
MQSAFCCANYCSVLCNHFLVHFCNPIWRCLLECYSVFDQATFFVDPHVVSSLSMHTLSAILVLWKKLEEVGLLLEICVFFWILMQNVWMIQGFSIEHSSLTLLRVPFVDGFLWLTWNCKQNSKLYFLAFCENRKQNLMRIEMCMEIQQLCCGLHMLVTFRIQLKVVLGGVFASWLLQTNSTSCAVVQK